MIELPQDHEPDHYYLAGPMSGYPDYNFPAFRKCAKRLRDIGYKILSPVELVEQDELPPGSRTWEWYLKRDMFQMLQCKGIILMVGWRQSRGARAELQVADTLGMEVFTMDHMMKLTFNRDYGRGRTHSIAGSRE